MTGAVLAMCAAADQKTNPHEKANLARVEFEKGPIAVFAKSVLVDYTVAAESNRHDRASGAGEWLFALPVARDERLRFARATFEDGRFVKGNLSVFGLPPKAVTAAEFEALRDGFPMIAIRVVADAKPGRTACLYPARRDFPSEFKVSVKSVELGGGTVALGALGKSVRRLGVDTSRLGYAFVFSKDGFVADLGSPKETCGAAREEAIFAKLRAAVEAADTDRRGLVTNRDLADLWDGAAIVRKGVLK